jgi:hypothetical protein
MKRAIQRWKALKSLGEIQSALVQQSQEVLAQTRKEEIQARKNMQFSRDQADLVMTDWREQMSAGRFNPHFANHLASYWLERDEEASALQSDHARIESNVVKAQEIVLSDRTVQQRGEGLIRKSRLALARILEEGMQRDREDHRLRQIVGQKI